MSALVLGLDGGLASVGWAVCEPSSQTAAGFRVRNAGVFHTKKDPKALVSDDSKRRVNAIVTFLERVCAAEYALVEAEPWGGYHLAVNLVCVERISHPGNASSAIKVAMFWGGLGVVTRGIDMLAVSPGAIKRACGVAPPGGRHQRQRDQEEKKRTKAAVQAHVREVFDFRWDGNKGDAEHVHDALGAIYACRHADIALAAIGRRRAA